MVEIAGIETTMNINNGELSLTEVELHPENPTESAAVAENGTRTIGTQSIVNHFNRTLHMVSCLD